MQSDVYINDIYLPLLDDESRHLILYGSAGSGKSEFAAVKKLLRLQNEKGHRFVFSRKVAKTIRGSQFALFKDIITRYNWSKYFHIRESSMDITCKQNGNQLLSAGLDDEEKLKSITGITGWWLEEATEFEPNDLKQINLRIRGETNNYKQIIYTFNPIDEEHHIRKRFFPEGS